MSVASDSFTEPDDETIAEAIRVAERKTSGEFRVFVSRHLCDDPGLAAHQEFTRLDMTRTPLRNAVLLYVAPRSKAFAVACDESIQFRCAPDFEVAMTAAAMPALTEGRIEDAILSALRTGAEHLARHFPPYSLDRDDLPNTLIRD